MNNLTCGVPIYNFPVPSHRKEVKQTYAMNPKGVVVHNTWNSAPAKNEASFMVGNSKYVSYHSVVDEIAVYECIPFNRNAWHAGNYYYNTNWQGVEIARSRSDLAIFKKAEINAAKYVAAILKKNGWNTKQHLKTHQMCSGKYCPHRTLDLGWQRFVNMVEAEMKGNKLPSPPLILLAEEEVAKYSVRVDVPAGDVLNVRKGPGTEYPVVNGYKPNSVIYVETVVKNSQGAWYKIPGVGYVSSKYCKGIPPKNKKEGGYFVQTNTPNDVLNVRERATVSSRIVSTYRDKSKIYVHDVVKNNEGAWYKIEYREGIFGFVSSKYCIGIK